MLYLSSEDIFIKRHQMSCSASFVVVLLYTIPKLYNIIYSSISCHLLVLPLSLHPPPHPPLTTNEGIQAEYYRETWLLFFRRSKIALWSLGGRKKTSPLLLLPAGLLGKRCMLEDILTYCHLQHFHSWHIQFLSRGATVMAVLLFYALSFNRPSLLAHSQWHCCWWRLSSYKN